MRPVEIRNAAGRMNVALVVVRSVEGGVSRRCGVNVF